MGFHLVVEVTHSANRPQRAVCESDRGLGGHGIAGNRERTRMREKRRIERRRESDEKKGNASMGGELSLLERERMWWL